MTATESTVVALDDAIDRAARTTESAELPIEERRAEIVQSAITGMSVPRMRAALAARDVACNGRKAEVALCLLRVAVAEIPRRQVKVTADGYADRLKVVRDRIGDYDQQCDRRRAADEWHAAMHRIRSADGWLAGDHDVSYVERLHGTRDQYRIKYACDALRSALHHVVWAEMYAGVITRDAALAADPFRQLS